MHREICVGVAEAGKHFMVEKPLTTSLSEADELIAKVRASGVKAMTCSNRRWIASYARAMAEIDAGKLGRPVLAYARKNDRIYVKTKMLSWAVSTTPAWFLSSHDIDLVTWFFGPEARATEVYATAVWGALQHMVTCVLEYREPLVTLESSRHVTAILDAIYRSMESGAPETVR